MSNTMTARVGLVVLLATSIPAIAADTGRVDAGTGGFSLSSADDAWERITAGANLVQIYSALIFEGPGLPARINRGLAAHVKRAGFSRISDAVGSRAQAQA